jgi:hypothetical protein
MKRGGCNVGSEGYSVVGYDGKGRRELSRLRLKRADLIAHRGVHLCEPT